MNSGLYLNLFVVLFAEELYDTVADFNVWNGTFL